MQAQRYSELDSLRGIAAVAVVVFHTQNYWNGRPYSFFNWGYLCVDLFFIISGIVLTRTYEKKIISGEMSFGHFMGARISRIAPLHWAVLIFLAIANALLFRFSVAHQYIISWDASVYGFITSALFVQNSGLFPEQTWNPAAWSISAEICVNILWFWALRHRRATLPMLIGVAFGSMLLLYNGYSIHHARRNGATFESVYEIFNGGILRCVTGFAIGIAIERHISAWRKCAAKVGRTWMNIGAAITMLSIVLLVVNHDAPRWSGIDYISVALIFPTLILLSLTRGLFLSEILRLKPLAWLGERSYSIYMIHIPMMLCLPAFLDATKLDIRYPWLGIAFMASVLVASAMVFKFLESPARKMFRRKLSSERESAKKADSSPLMEVADYTAGNGVLPAETHAK